MSGHCKHCGYDGCVCDDDLQTIPNDQLVTNNSDITEEQDNPAQELSKPGKVFHNGVGIADMYSTEEYNRLMAGDEF